MSAAVDVVPRESADCAWKVVQRNAPGAISAIAFTVTPVSVKLRLISPLLVAAVSAIAVSSLVGGADAPPFGSVDEYRRRAMPFGRVAERPVEGP